MSASESQLKLTFDMHRIRIQRLFRTRPIYRNIFCGTIVFIALYGVINVFTPRSGMTSLLPHSWQSGSNGGPAQGGLWEERQQRVKKAFVHAYHGYEKYAAPMDELKPLSNMGLNKCVGLHYPAREAIVNTVILCSFNGWGVTAFDALDTMLMMDLKDEYQRALNIVRKADFTTSQVSLLVLALENP